MLYRQMTPFHTIRHSGASLIEVLVAIVILSFGMLALGAMLTYSVQAPKLSAYRATAASLASAHVERIRANPDGFGNDNYTASLSYDGTTTPLTVTNCAYPSCTVAALATMDNTVTKQAVRAALPAGGMIMKCDVALCTSGSYGNLWIVWLEPSTASTLNPTTSDNCPSEVTASFSNPPPRCLYLRFKI